MELYNKAIQLWANIIKIDEISQKNYFTFSEISIKQDCATIQESFELDPSGITSLLLLKYYFDDFLKTNEISLYDLINNLNSISTQFKDILELNNLLNSTEFLDFQENIILNIEEIIKTYKIENNLLDYLKKNYCELGLIQYNAYKAVKELRINKFKKGIYSNTSPVFYEDVYIFNSIEELLNTTNKMKDGILFSIILVPNRLNSFFVFTIKNGQNIYVIDDKLKEMYPGQENCTRNPERMFSDRTSMWKFPYELLFKIMDNEENKNTTEIVPITNILCPINKIVDVNSIVWIYIIVTFFKNKYFNEKNTDDLELSYLKSDIVLSISSSNLPVDTKKIDLSTINSNTINHSNLSDFWNRKPTGVNNKFEEHFRSELNEIVDSKLPMIVDKLSLNNYGTESDIKKNLIYITRKVQANKLSNLMYDDFQLNKLEACKWFHELCKNNLDIIYKHVYSQETWNYTYINQRFGFNRNEKETFKYITLQDKNKVKDSIIDLRTYSDVLIKFRDYYSPKFIYADVDLTTFPYTYSCTSINFEFKDINHIKDFFNITDNNIPYYLQYWSTNPPYTGNSLLDFIDPVDNVESPYNKLKFRIEIIFISKLYNKKVKELNKNK